MMGSQFSLDVNFAYGAPDARGEFRSCPEDFVVTENLSHGFSGEGDHLAIKIKKRGENTQWVADKLAAFFKIKSIDVGFYGLKDRHAVTTQWFSAHVPKYEGEIDWNAFRDQYNLDVEVLDVQRHVKKIRRGEHASNRFEIRLRNMTDVEVVQKRLEHISKFGVPNYFGEQRFGREGNNLNAAQTWIDSKRSIKNKKKRGMIYSSARSYLFNTVLSARVERNNWNVAVDGDVLDDIELPTGPLWGRGRSSATMCAADVERVALEPWEAWCLALEHVGLSHERRTFVLNPLNFSWVFVGNDLTVSFQLAPGQFATSVLREICQLKRVARE